MRSLNAGLLLRNFLLRPVPIDADVEGGVDIDGADADDNLKKRRHLKKKWRCSNEKNLEAPKLSPERHFPESSEIIPQKRRF